MAGEGWQDPLLKNLWHSNTNNPGLTVKYDFYVT